MYLDLSPHLPHTPQAPVLAHPDPWGPPFSPRPPPGLPSPTPRLSAHPVPAWAKFGHAATREHLTYLRDCVHPGGKEAPRRLASRVRCVSATFCVLGGHQRGRGKTYEELRSISEVDHSAANTAMIVLIWISRDAARGWGRCVVNEWSEP